MASSTPNVYTHPLLHHNIIDILSSPLSDDLPLREIPGSYGLPFIGAIKDRWDFFYNQGIEEFFNSRMENYKSTVYRVNMPPGPAISNDSKVIVLLDGKSFPILFDVSKVEKRDVFTGTYMPSTSYTGGFRVCAYLDPSESKHGSLKGLFLSFIASKHEEIIPTFHTCLEGMFSALENQMNEKGSAEYVALNDDLSFEFVFRLYCDGKSPKDTKLEANGPTLAKTWLIGQLAPITTLGLPKFLSPIEDFILHSIPLPFFLVKDQYEKLYNAFLSSATSFLNQAEKTYGLKRDEACHNLVFVASFNSFGGFTKTLPALVKWVGSAGKSLHQKLASEIRAIVKSEGGVTLNGINKMPLTKSVIFEALRIEPPVPYQYGKAKQDLVIESHDAKFNIKKGEMIFGYQPFATNDPKIFDNPEKFIGDRFVGDGEKLLEYVYWSNGLSTVDPTTKDKQCPGKDLVELISKIFLVEFFLRYDTFTVEVGSSLSGESITFLSLEKATSSI